MSVLQSGDRGDAVKEMQRLLKDLSFHEGSIDGIFGPGTEESVRDFQSENGLHVDGIYGPQSKEVLEEISGVSEGEDRGTLTDSDFDWAAKALGVEEAVIRAFAKVESGGSAFFSNGKPAILFERHIMYRRLETHGLNLLQKIASEAVPELVGKDWDRQYYKGGVKEYDRLDFAMQLDPTSAIESCSWGKFQIMGMHWSRLGYESAHEFMQDMNESASNHLDAFVKFIKTERKVKGGVSLHQALKGKDWATAAYLYNGPGYASHATPYDEQMAEAYKKYSS